MSADAARAVAEVALLIQSAGSEYVRWNLRLVAGPKARRDLATDLEWFALGPDEADRFDPQARADLRQAAARALELLPAELGEDFFTNVKTAIGEAR
jgi:hypothetical protein